MWTSSSNWFIAVWRNTVAIDPSIDSASSDRRDSGVARLLEQAAEDERLAEHRCRLGERQRRALLEHAARAGELGVQAVAHLVGEDEHVAALGRVVEHEVGVLARDGVRGERAAALGRPRRGVDPVSSKNARAGSPSSGVKSA